MQEERFPQNNEFVEIDFYSYGLKSLITIFNKWKEFRSTLPINRNEYMYYEGKVFLKGEYNSESTPLHEIYFDHYKLVLCDVILKYKDLQLIKANGFVWIVNRSKVGRRFYEYEFYTCEYTLRKINGSFHHHDSIDIKEEGC